MKPKYEISIWSDVYNEELGRFEEQKEIVIGSDIMTSEARARNPKMVSNVNGTNKFSFDLYYKYTDTQTGEKIANPYIPYLVNERKIKVLWKGEWYDLLVKQIKENQVDHVFNYVCEDSYITELSRTGFELEFATELQNNIGTAQELVEKVIDGTEWQYDEEGSDVIYQETEEAVYESTTMHSFTAQKAPDGQDTTIEAGRAILIFYSSAYDKDNLKPKCQFYYTTDESWKQDVNDMLVINGDCYEVEVEWTQNSESVNVWDAKIGNNIIFSVNFGEGLSGQYRAKRLVQSQKSVYSEVLNRYVNVYTYGDEKIYGYQTTEYNDATTVVNLVTNSSNFKDLSGWVGENMVFSLSPAFDSDTVIAEYKADSYLILPHNKTYYNSGLYDNRTYNLNGFTEGEKYIFRFKGKPAEGNQIIEEAAFYSNPREFEPSIHDKTSDYQPTGDEYFTIIPSEEIDDENHWITYYMTCSKSCAYNKLDSIGLFFKVKNTTNTQAGILDIQFFKEVKNSDETIIEPGKMDTQSVARVVWRYFQEPEAGTKKEDLEYIHTSIDEWSEATPVYNQYERYGTIEESQSNRFNILQSIAEKFECWTRFVIKHDDKGYILFNSEGRREKYIRIKKEFGQETGIGFIYGVDLKGVTRITKSNQISTKTIVSQNENEFGENGFCSIARSQYNYPRENVIYNFDYYIQQGLLSRDVLNNELYGINGYYTKLHNNNTQYAVNLDELIEKKTELTRQTAMAKVYEQYKAAAIKEKQSIEDSLMKLAGVSSYADVNNYAQTHLNDTKVQSLINDHTMVENTITNYENLIRGINGSISTLQSVISTLEDEQNDIIDTLRSLNKAFFVKFGPYIQEGTWSSEDYWNDDLYYLDALQVAYTSSRPQVQYDIDVLRISDVEEYSSKVFHLGDISFIQDVEYFGYLSDKITPYKEKVILSEITSYFDTPDKDTIKVQNYKTQFDDLFQRITAATQSLEFSEGKYARAANIVNADGTIKSSVIQDTFNSNKDLVYGAQNESVTMDNTGVTVVDNDNAARLVKLTSGGVFVSNDGGNTWNNAIRGDGINTELLTAGRINTEQINIYNGNAPSFRWDPYGLNAYGVNTASEIQDVNTRKFVRFDQYGVYGLELTGVSNLYIPTSINDIYRDAKFGMTWEKFFIKNITNNGGIEINSDSGIIITDNNIERVKIGLLDISGNYGIQIKGNDDNFVFKCDNNTAELCGWQLGIQKNGNTELYKYLKSENIELRSTGAIGSFATNSSTVDERAYIVTTSVTFNATDMRTSSSVSIPQGATIYIFSSFIGSRTTTKTTNENYNSLDDSLPSTFPSPQSKIQFKYGSGNYEIDNLTWSSVVQSGQTTHVTQVIQSGNEPPYTTTYRTVYTYQFNLNTTGITIPYNASTSIQSKYIAAHDFSWEINSNGSAIFHDIAADGGQIAGWFIDSDKIYQTTNGQRDGPIKTELNSQGKATTGGIDYTFITDAINAGMAVVGDVALSGGLINGYNIAQLAQQVQYAIGLAQSAYNHLPKHSHQYRMVGTGTNVPNGSDFANHTHPIVYSENGTTGTAGT